MGRCSTARSRPASRPGFPLSALAGELRDARARLDVLDADDAASSVRAVFSWSYQKLSDPAAQEAMRNATPKMGSTLRGRRGLVSLSILSPRSSG